MPPSSRSSSSHSSSSRSSSSSHSSSSHSYSSSRSSSSHSSGSSYSSRSSSSYSSGSSYRSGPSRRSTSSHNSFSRSTSSHSNVLTGGVPIRVRSKQPRGYNHNTPGFQTPTTYHCRKHDYVYYASGWTDAQTGTIYEPGYYDENGQYYDKVTFKDKSSGILTMKCEYCDSAVKTTWTEGAQPTCPNCGAVLKIDEADEVISSYKEATDVPEKGKWHPVVFAFMALLLLGGSYNNRYHALCVQIFVKESSCVVMCRHRDSCLLYEFCAGR